MKTYEVWTQTANRAVIDRYGFDRSKALAAYKRHCKKRDTLDCWLVSRDIDTNKQEIEEKMKK